MLLHPTEIRSVVVGTDRSPEGRHAAEMGSVLALRSRARLVVLEVVRLPAEGAVPAGRRASTSGRTPKPPELLRLERWLGRPPGEATGIAPEAIVGYGVPGIEIGRVADELEADLIVLGRRQRTPDQPLLLGETADAVVRRSAKPVLFVPHLAPGLRRMLLAVDGSERTLSLLPVAAKFAGTFGAELIVVTVQLPDGSYSGEGAARVRRALSTLGPGSPADELIVRTGNPITEILGTLQVTAADVLMIGYRRGGPPKVVGPADIARNLLYAAPSAVFTYPL